MVVITEKDLYIVEGQHQGIDRPVGVVIAVYHIDRGRLAVITVNASVIDSRSTPTMPMHHGYWLVMQLVSWYLNHCAVHVSILDLTYTCTVHTSHQLHLSPLLAL